MVWLTWRQHRAQILVTAGFLAAMGVVLLVHGLAAAGLQDEALGAHYHQLYLYVSWLPVVPLVAGLFWGAPLLARELERGTHRLAWTQSVSRLRWLTVKVGVLGLAVRLAGLTLGLMVGAWLSAFDGTGDADRFGDTALFGATGVLGGVWWLLAFVLGTATGGVLRRTLPAFAVTIAVFVLAMMALFAAREGYAEPEGLVVEGADAMPTWFVRGAGMRDHGGRRIPGVRPRLGLPDRPVVPAGRPALAVPADRDRDSRSRVGAADRPGGVAGGEAAGLMPWLTGRQYRAQVPATVAAIAGAWLLSAREYERPSR
jgi:hypothetical protein